MVKNVVRQIIRVLVAIGLATTTAFADDVPPQNPRSELRIGIMAHDAYPVWLPSTPTDFRFNQIKDVGFDLLLRSPDTDFFRWMGSPRPNFGGTLNFDGQESMVHLALTWQARLPDTPVYVEGTIGAALHNGLLTGVFGKLRPQGCRLGFYTGIGLGVDITEKLTATLVYEHMSNADMCSANFGLSNVGIKLGVKFD